MEALLSMFKNVVLFVALAVPGYLLVKTKMLNSAHSGVLSKLLMYVGKHPAYPSGPPCPDAESPDGSYHTIP